MHEIEKLDKILRERAKKGNKLPPKIEQRIHGMRGNALPQPAPKDFAEGIRKASHQATMDQRQLTISNLSLDVEPTDLGNFFKGYDVESISIAYDSITDVPTGSAYVDFKATEAANGAMQALNGKMLLGKVVVLEVSKAGSNVAEVDAEVPDAIIVLSDDEDDDDDAVAAQDAGVMTLDLRPKQVMTYDSVGEKDFPILISDDESTSFSDVHEPLTPASDISESVNLGNPTKTDSKSKIPYESTRARDLARRIQKWTETEPKFVKINVRAASHFQTLVEEGGDFIRFKGRLPRKKRRDRILEHRASLVRPRSPEPDDEPKESNDVPMEIEAEPESVSEGSGDRFLPVYTDQHTDQDQLKLVRDYLDMQNAQRANYNLQPLELWAPEIGPLTSNTIIDPEGEPDRKVTKDYIAEAARWNDAVAKGHLKLQQEMTARARNKAYGLSVRKFQIPLRRSARLQAKN
jgi:hypothetical protein